MNDFTKFTVPTTKFKRLRDFLIPLNIQEKLIRHVENLRGFRLSAIDKKTKRERSDKVWVTPYPFVTSAENIENADLEMYQRMGQEDVTKKDVLRSRIERYHDRFITNDALNKIDNNESKVSLVHIYSGDVNVLDTSTSDLDQTEVFIIPERLPMILRELKIISYINKASDQEVMEKAYADIPADELENLEPTTIEALAQQGREWNCECHMYSIARALLADRYLLGIRVHGHNGETDSELLGTTPEAVHTKEQMDIISQHVLQGLKNKDKVILIV